MSNPFAISNDKSISYRSSNGTLFECVRADLKEPVVVKDFNPLHETDLNSINDFVKDVAEFIGYHAINIYPELTGGFSGYDTLTFKYE